MICICLPFHGLQWVELWHPQHKRLYSNPWKLWLLHYLEKKGLCRYKLGLGVRLPWLTQLGPKFNDKHPYKRQKRRQTQKEGNMNTEAETGMMQPKGSWEPPEVRKIGKDSPLEAPKVMWPCQHLDFRHLASRALRQSISVVLNHLVCGNLLHQL